MIGPLLAVASFAAMEGVSYATHRWVMHGRAIAWHRSHHAPARGRFERNDLFPVCFSALGIALFVLAATGAAAALWWVAGGVTAYGALYLFVHDVYIHRRLPVSVPRLGYLEWLRESHRRHHVGSGEPYGMLLPLVRRGRASVTSARDPLDRTVRRASTR
ncbi:MAG: beta-carotene hydroxylase [Acidimicrobiia bacterium]|nr:beta-carotene hydroxylase [Acidimicrobiia bacterium]